MLGFLAGVPGKLKAVYYHLTTYWTEPRATKIDNLDATISSRAPSSTALSSTTWTSARAGYIDYLLRTNYIPGRCVIPYSSAGSHAFVAPLSGLYRFYVLGAGGSGGIALSGEFGGVSALGGGGGALAVHEVFLNAGDSCTITVGAGGTAVSRSGGVGATSGNQGGASSVVGPASAWTVTANGGLGGTAVANQNAQSAITAATATGGSIANISGGVSGSTVALGAYCAATGGGAAATLLGQGKSSGSVTSSAAVYSTGGGGTWSAGINDSTTPGGGLTNNLSAAGALTAMLNPFLRLYDSSIGLGGTGSTTAGGTQGNLFAGGGASKTNTYTIYGGAGGIGAGGGAMCVITHIVGPDYSGAGGGGLVVVEF